MRVSLAADGQRSPVSMIGVMERDAAGFVLIDGYLRVHAARALAWDIVEAVLLPMAEADALIMTHRTRSVGAARSRMAGFSMTS